ncbi:pyridoxal kinase-like isoform X1 [Artemia franciscana]
MYVPKELVPIYAKEVVKVADILTPNQYEAELLTGMKIASEEDAVRVIDHFHKEGVKIVVLSSTDLGSDDELISFASIATDGKHEMYRITIPCIRDTFTGTGDLFAALFLAWTSKTDNNVKVSLEKTQASLQAVLKRTMEHAKSVAPSGAKLYPRYLELRLVQSMDIFLSPPEMCKASRIR